MQALIIGGTGVASRAIAEHAVAEGYQVTIVTNGRGQLPEPMGIKRHIIVDRDDGVHFEAEISALGVKHWDLVIDAACYNENHAVEMRRQIRHRSSHTIVLSTGIVYGRESRMPFTPDGPLGEESELGSYAAGKARMEAAWLNIAKEDGEPVTIFRPPHIVGIGCELGAIPLHNRDVHVIDRLKKGKPLYLADGGRQLIQVVAAEDLATVALAAARNENTFGKVYNCANPEIITGRGYYERIAEALGVTLRVVSVSADAILASTWGWRHSVSSWLFDIDDLRRDVGIVPSTPYRKAIEKPLQYIIDRVPTVPGSNDFLDACDSVVSDNCVRLSELLSQLAPRRHHTTVDLRMNQDLLSGQNIRLAGKHLGATMGLDNILGMPNESKPSQPDFLF